MLTPLVTMKLFPSTAGAAGNGSHVPPVTLVEYSNPNPLAFVGHESTRLSPCRVPVKVGAEACPTKVTTLNGGNWYVNAEFVITTAAWLENESALDVTHGIIEPAVKLLKLKVWLIAFVALLLIATIANALEFVALYALTIAAPEFVTTPIR